MNSYPDEIVNAENSNAASLMKRASNVTNVLADQLTAAAKSAAGYVRSSPWQAAGAVALAGIAAGLLVSRGASRSRRRRGRPAEVESSPEFGG
jgi:ElaB/YqjD/DUF883 family membrane-anchored ribosome-binding protein